MATSREILDHPILSERYFFPRRDAVADPWIVESAGLRLRCARRGPDDAPVVLHFHGNGEVVADWADDLGAALGAEAIATCFGEYRGYGGSDGVPALAAMLDDALAVLDALGIDPARVVVYGRSVGSLYALHVAANRPVAALVLESGIADLRERLLLRARPEELGVDADELTAAVDALFDHRAKIEATAGPVSILHARRDHLVGFEHGERLAGWAGGRGQLVAFDRGDHNSIHAYNGPAIVAHVADLVRRTTG